MVNQPFWPGSTGSDLPNQEPALSLVQGPIRSDNTANKIYLVVPFLFSSSRPEAVCPADPNRRLHWPLFWVASSIYLIMATTETTVLRFSFSSTGFSAKVQPLVIFNICDFYVRRPDGAERVIGTLLGSILPDGTVDIRNSYAVPHNEFSDQVWFFSLPIVVIRCFMIWISEAHVASLVLQDLFSFLLQWKYFRTMKNRNIFMIECCRC